MIYGYILIVVSLSVAVLCNTKFNATNIGSSDINRVIGGDEVKTPVPYQVSLQYKSKGKWKHFCGGTIISEDYILTAAHCIKNKNVSRMAVLAGTINLNAGGSRHNVILYHAHDNFTDLSSSDIGLVKVTPSFKFDQKYISKISFEDKMEIPVKSSVILTGWGSIAPSTFGPYPSGLQIVESLTISDDECERRGIKVTSSILCAYKWYGNGACVGDSGGPLVDRNMTKLIGVVSYGTFPCANGIPDVYTKVSTYVDWIKMKMLTE